MDKSSLVFSGFQWNIVSGKGRSYSFDCFNRDLESKSVWNGIECTFEVPIEMGILSQLENLEW